ncbi:hypothetical protein XthCFBP4691_18590 [Xanthomonas theicola]|uniref:DUF924 domain-containing protein n=1 Tax=Xanthomonas theicola TaxID=56464 RepID=A0A2S6ZAV2_9XANT|nr:hypothetical protein XthCFBP4691_18590 [Xanthomonas theicola]
MLLHDRHDQGQCTTHRAVRHEDAIQRFGRFPHRSPALGRETTQEEREFLDADGFAG